MENHSLSSAVSIFGKKVDRVFAVPSSARPAGLLPCFADEGHGSVRFSVLLGVMHPEISSISITVLLVQIRRPRGRDELVEIQTKEMARKHGNAPKAGIRG